MRKLKLIDCPVFFVDLQTTGAKPESGNIVEIAWGKCEGAITSLLVEQPDSEPIPRRIQMLTGIKETDMFGAIPISEVMSRFQNFISDPQNQNGLCIIHFAQFEKPFLRSAFKGDIPFPILCTLEIAKRLYPHLPSRGIKGLAGFFGNNTGEFKRANCHVDATRMIWKRLVRELTAQGIHTLEELLFWLAATPKIKKSRYEYPLPKEKRLQLPDVPGIYRMLNSRGEVLYVGKATSLFHRVNSYFRGQKNRDSKKLEMLTQVYDIRVTTCGSPLEAALMETDEIKNLNPYYNIALKVGFRSLIFFNRDFTSMNDVCDEEHMYGPYSSALVFHSMLKLNEFARSTDINSLPSEDLFYEIIDPELILTGLGLLCIRHGLELKDLSSMRSIMALGLIWERRIRDEDEIEKTELTAEDIADKFERHFMRVGRAYIKSRKLNEMLNCRIIFNEQDSSQQELCIRNGKICKDQLNENQDIPWQNEIVQTYDRMTVLTTELERIKTQGGRYKIISKGLNILLPLSSQK
ncbi:MAG: GIY-YIG nuclease family protein [Bacteriovorax sp.]|jgi:DNA polymerase-3 subunit epsilon